MILRRQRTSAYTFASTLLYLVLVLVVSLVSSSENVDTIPVHSRTDRNRRVEEDPSTFTVNQSANSSAAYQKCYSLLDEVAAAAATLNQEEYLEFLQLITNGSVSETRFRDLPALFVMIFYSAACFSGEGCNTGITPKIEVDDTNEPAETLQLFCKHVLKETTSKTDASFEYSIRYNPDRIKIDALSDCLSVATVNVLLEQLAGCPWLPESPPVDMRRFLQSETVQEAVMKSRSWATYNAEKDERRLTSLGSASTPDDSPCPYYIESSVERITEVSCDDSINPIAGDDELCGLVRSTATVVVEQLLEPFETLLRIQTISVLRRVINGGEFLTYFPPGTCLLS